MAVVYSRPQQGHAGQAPPSAPQQSSAPPSNYPAGVTPSWTIEKPNGRMEGFFVGAATGFYLFLAGAFLTATILLAIIGIPLMIAGILAPFVGPLVNEEQQEGDCPYCGTRVKTRKRALGFNCPACKERILLGADTFRRKNVTIY